MERAVLQVLVVLALGMHYRCASGFPVYDYDPSSLREALSASVAKVNSQSLSPYLFRATRSSLKRVNVLDEDTLVMNLEFSVQETTCLRDSDDPSTCAFQKGYHVPTAACRSTVQMSRGQVKDVWAHCRWAFTSESSSSEEMIFGDMERSYRRRNDYLLGFLSDESRSEQIHDRSVELPSEATAYSFNVCHSSNCELLHFYPGNGQNQEINLIDHIDNLHEGFITDCYIPTYSQIQHL